MQLLGRVYTCGIKSFRSFSAFVERCDWLQQICLVNIFQHVRFRQQVLQICKIFIGYFLLHTWLHVELLYVVVVLPW